MLRIRQHIQLQKDKGFTASIWTRMLFSCLVDADFLATENFMDPEKASQRPGNLPLLPKLIELLDGHVAEKERRTSSSETVARMRRIVREACQAKSALGLDSIAQAAGRCNREGRLPRGNVFVFEFADGKQPQFLRPSIQAATAAIHGVPDEAILGLESLEMYFRHLYWQAGGPDGSGWDQLKIMECFALDKTSQNMPFLFQFRTAAERFRWIEDNYRPVIIPWGERGEKLCHLLRLPEPPKGIHRKLQRYTVTIPERLWSHNLALGNIELLHGRFPVLAPPAPGPYYHTKLGLTLPEPGCPLDFLHV